MIMKTINTYIHIRVYIYYKYIYLKLQTENENEWYHWKQTDIKSWEMHDQDEYKTKNECEYNDGTTVMDINRAHQNRFPFSVNKEKTNELRYTTYVSIRGLCVFPYSNLENNKQKTTLMIEWDRDAICKYWPTFPKPIAEDVFEFEIDCDQNWNEIYYY